jgi:hypothetical protein
MRMKTLTDRTMFYLLPKMFIWLSKHSQSEVLYIQHIEDELVVSGKCQANSTTIFFKACGQVLTRFLVVMWPASHTYRIFLLGCQFSSLGSYQYFMHKF